MVNAMEINSAFNAGLQGLQQSRQNIDQAASEIASAGAARRDDGQQQSSVDIAEQLVELRRHELAYKASAEVVRSADQLLSKLVDEMA